MIKNILFDMGGVVFIQNTDRAFRLFREAGIDTDRYMGVYGQKEFFLDLETGTIDTDEFCRQMALATGRESVSFEQAQHCWLGFIEDVPVDRLHFLLKLKQRYQLGLLSNTNPFIMDFTNSPRFSNEALPISHYFHALYLSYEMKVCKPLPDIFLKTLELGNMKPEETLFVDDSRKNIEAAEALGIRGFHVDTNQDWMQSLTQKLDSCRV